jgi:hypothetical protein
MKKLVCFFTFTFCFAAGIPGISGQTLAAKAEGAADTYWAKFQAAVAKQDIEAVASSTKFPLAMPYGVRSIKSRAELKRRYSRIFDPATRKCFSTARPNFDEGRKDRFSINCGEAMMYWFELVNGQYRFSAVDNVNE